MGFYPEKWGGKTLEQMIAELKVWQRIINAITDYTPLVKGKNVSAYNGPKIAAVAAQDLPLVYDDGDFTDPSKTNISISFNQKKGVGLIVNDINDAQTDLGLLAIYTEQAKNSLLDAYDLYIVQQIITNLASANRKQLNDSVNDKLTEADFILAEKTLDEAGAPTRNRFAIVNPTHKSHLYEISNFISADKIRDTEAIKKGVFGQLHGFDVLMYKDMPKVDSNGILTDTAHLNRRVSLFFQSLCYGFGRQREFGAKTEPKAGVPGDLVNIYSVFGGSIQDSTYALSFRENASSGS